jgi:hypothetical protein
MLAQFQPGVGSEVIKMDASKVPVAADQKTMEGIVAGIEKHQYWVELVHKEMLVLQKDLADLRVG